MVKELPYRLYKFGKTNSVDVLERFSRDRHYSLKWRGIPLSEDYDVSVIWSHWVSKKEAKEAEEWFKENYPKKFFCKKDFNGITECRDWDPRQSYAFSHELRKRYPSNKEYEEGITKLLKENILCNTHDKIYFVMLTKK